MAERPPRFPPTQLRTWPGLVVDVPPVTASWLIVRDTGSEFFELHRRVRRVQLPVEAHLSELFELELGNPDAMVHWVNRFGWLGAVGWSALPTSYGANTLPNRRGGGVSALDYIYKAVMSECARRGVGDTWERRSFRHIDEFRVHAAALRNAVRTWIAVSNESRLDELVVEWEPLVPGSPEELPAVRAFDRAIRTPPENVGLAESRLANVLTAGLAEFHLAVFGPDESDAPGYWGVSMYGALCLQLHNDIAERARYAQCANEPCGRWFSRQRGGALAGQYRRHGVRYCSKTCARAQGERERRKRKREREREREREQQKGSAQ